MVTVQVCLYQNMLLRKNFLLSGTYDPHTTVTVSVATLRSRQRVTKEMVGG
jgi:hypothetical protein